MKIKIDLSKSLDAMKATFLSRSKDYSDGYNRHGEILKILFPDGITFESDFGVRFFFIDMIVAKLVRYCDNFKGGGHKDSIHDLSVYGSMLDNYDEQKVNQKRSMFQEPK